MTSDVEVIDLAITKMATGVMTLLLQAGAEARVGLEATFLTEKNKELYYGTKFFDEIRRSKVLLEILNEHIEIHDLKKVADSVLLQAPKKNKIRL